jgi:adenylosuccinate synthase
MAERLRESGQEYGASTGRPRRCGWFDAVVVRYAARVNGLDTLALTKLDVLDGLDELKIATAYRIDGRTTVDFPSNLAALSYEAIYETMPGWQEPTRGARSFDELPLQAQNYIARLEELSGVSCAIVSTGSDRDETIIRTDSIAERWLR